jgi:hypothetical protein
LKAIPSVLHHRGTLESHLEFSMTSLADREFSQGVKESGSRGTVPADIAICLAFA